MAIAFRAFPSANVVALFVEAPGGGDILDIDAPCNRPAKTPASWLSSIYFHSDLDYMEVAFEGAITVTHPATSAAGAPVGTTPTGAIVYGGYTATHVLANHALGYAATAMVSLGNNVITPGYPLPLSGGGMRFVTAYSTASQLLLHETAMRTGASAAEARTYNYLIFRNPPAPSGNKLIDFDPETGILQLAKGRFNSGRKYLQVVPGGTPYFFMLGRTIDLQNGALRIVDAKGNVFDPVNAGLQLRLSIPSTSAFGGTMGYNGSFAGGGAILVQTP